MKKASPTRMKIGVTTVYFHGSKIPPKLMSIGGREVGDQLSGKVRLVQLTISGEERKPPLMEVSLYLSLHLPHLDHRGNFEREMHIFYRAIIQ